MVGEEERYIDSIGLSYVDGYRMRLRLLRVLSVWSNQLKMSGVSLLTFKKAWQIPGK